jgi:dUTP pyrophosphatase
MEDNFQEINSGCVCDCKSFNSKKAIKVKKLCSDALIPQKAHKSDAGFDISAIDDGTVVFGNCGRISYIEYRTGIAIEPPVGYSVEAFPRSSISKYDLFLANSIGLLDNGYRGEIRLRFRILHDSSNFYAISQNDDQNTIQMKLEKYYGIKVYKKGDKIAQLVIRKDIVDFSMVEVDNLEGTPRSDGGFGSSGK